MQRDRCITNRSQVRNVAAQLPECWDVRMAVEEEWRAEAAQILFCSGGVHHVLHDRIAQRRVHQRCGAHLQDTRQCAQP
ncbi:MAG: hypothetical protein ACKOJD_06345, partial [Candidatus Limnocylindrus sp.]